MNIYDSIGINCECGNKLTIPTNELSLEEIKKDKTNEDNKELINQYEKEIIKNPNTLDIFILNYECPIICNKCGELTFVDKNIILKNFNNDLEMIEYARDNGCISLSECLMYGFMIHMKDQKIKEKITKGYIYLISDDRYIKIGITKNIKNRINSIQHGNPDANIIYYKYIENYVNIEKILHEKYKSKKIKGEWFKLSEYDINEIKVYLEEVNEITQKTE